MEKDFFTAYLPRQTGRQNPIEAMVKFLQVTKGDYFVNQYLELINAATTSIVTIESVEHAHNVSRDL